MKVYCFQNMNVKTSYPLANLPTAASILQQNILLYLVKIHCTWMFMLLHFQNAKNKNQTKLGHLKKIKKYAKFKIRKSSSGHSQKHHQNVFMVLIITF